MGKDIHNEAATESSNVRSGAPEPSGTWVFQSHDSDMDLVARISNAAAAIREPPVTYPANKQAKGEVACVGLNRSLEQSLQHVGVYYPAERLLPGYLEGRERLRVIALHGRTCCY
ncbi:uncharacterized protein TNCV_2213621 [Trichonephila clavipes]|nr:uncharacterized protein TNCV_2213621 [Trichonephila clavipes]